MRGTILDGFLAAVHNDVRRGAPGASRHGPYDCYPMPLPTGGPYATLALWLAVLGLLAAVGIYVIVKLRGTDKLPEQTASELLTNFRQLHERGELSDEEYRTIKAMLRERLEKEVSDSGKSP